jgi:hypothetical protein
MACASDDALAVEVLKHELASARAHITALQAALLEATGAIVCAGCHRLQHTEQCPWCTGLEGRRWSSIQI